MSHTFKKKSPNELQEKLFFHDIINLTHGLLLFLSHKKTGQKCIEAHEISALEKEIRTLQMMLKEEYQHKHKNLDELSNWVPLFEIGPALNGLLENYLGQKNIPYTLNFKQELNAFLVHLPVFYRIMNNLIKNMAEADSIHAQIDMIFENGSLLIDTKNKVNESGKSIRSLEGVGGGLGLESIRVLTLLNGGSFSHEMINNLWCNHIILPLRQADIRTKNWSDKKAA